LIHIKEWRAAQNCIMFLLGLGKNIDSSMHCNFLRLNSISIHQILWIDSAIQASGGAVGYTLVRAFSVVEVML